MLLWGNVSTWLLLILTHTFDPLKLGRYIFIKEFNGRPPLPV